jgi:preprotein translocase subunit SecF
MEFFRIRKDIPFMRHVLVLNVISFITFARRCSSWPRAACTCRSSSPAARWSRCSTTQTADIEQRAAWSRHGLRRGAGAELRHLARRADPPAGAPDMKQTEVAGRVFAELCKAEPATVGTKQYTTPQGEQVSRPSCTAPSGVEPMKLMRTEFVGPSVGAELYENGAWALLAPCWASWPTWRCASSGSSRWPASSPTCTTWSSSWASSPSSSGSSRWPCWRPCWPCWAIR